LTVDRNNPPPFGENFFVLGSFPAGELMIPYMVIDSVEALTEHGIKWKHTKQNIISYYARVNDIIPEEIRQELMVSPYTKGPESTPGSTRSNV
jgi:hypothetical protein